MEWLQVLLEGSASAVTVIFFPFLEFTYVSYSGYWNGARPKCRLDMQTRIKAASTDGVCRSAHNSLSEVVCMCVCVEGCMFYYHCLLSLFTTVTVSLCRTAVMAHWWRSSRLIGENESCLLCAAVPYAVHTDHT